MIDDLKKQGYKYMYIKRGARKKLNVTKDTNVTDSSVFDEFTLETDLEKRIIKSLPRSVLINLKDIGGEIE